MIIVDNIRKCTKMLLLFMHTMLYALRLLSGLKFNIFALPVSFAQTCTSRRRKPQTKESVAGSRSECLESSRERVEMAPKLV